MMLHFLAHDVVTSVEAVRRDVIIVTVPSRRRRTADGRRVGVTGVLLATRHVKRDEVEERHGRLASRRDVLVILVYQPAHRA